MPDKLRNSRAARQRGNTSRRARPSQADEPAAGDLIEASGGLRKLRFGDVRRNTGKRGGLRVIYYYWTGGPEFWLFTLYDKGEAADLTPGQRVLLKVRLKDELRARRRS